MHMNVFLVGNGYDLHHVFPTSYINFINVVSSLIDESVERKERCFVGDVIGNKKLHTRDSFVKKCYEQHSSVYNEVELPVDAINEIIAKAKDNLWFNYFRNSVSRNIKWIDLEKEILTVIDAFDALFRQEDAYTMYNQDIIVNLSAVPRKENQFIVEKFGFFLEENTDCWLGASKILKVNEAYLQENVIGSSVYYLNEEKIVSYLYDDLCNFMYVLQQYMKLFVDNPAMEYARREIKPRWPELPTPQHVYSFNYTNTFEILYGNNMVDHIHGNTESVIVLGVNPDGHDEIEDMDTTFLQFKKYFQRAFSKTDASFIHKMRNARITGRGNHVELTVIGHSLAVTDKDIIKQVFQVADRITILYHKDSTVKNQIKNLIEIYGKSGFDELRDVKRLQFLPQGTIIWPEERND